MTNSINSVAGSLASLSTSSSSSSKLTDATKKKLEALGIDTTTIKTETQGLSLLSQIKNAQSPEQAKPAGPPGGPPPEMEIIKAQASSLASQLGVSVSSSAKISEIMDAISAAIGVEKTQAKGDATKLSKVEGYEAQYTQISSALSKLESQKQSGQAQISNGMSGMANYNKVFHNLT